MNETELLVKTLIERIMFLEARTAELEKDLIRNEKDIVLLQRLMIDRKDKNV